MYRLKLLLVGVSAALAASVGTAYASSIVHNALTERFKVSRIETANQFADGHVVTKGPVLELQANGVPAGMLRTTQINTKSPRFHVHDCARVTVSEHGHIAEPASLTLRKGPRLVVLDLKVDRDRVRMFTHTLDPVQLPDGKTAHGWTVNPGQVVGAAQELFTVTDLGTVWVIGDRYEKDLALVRVGSASTETVPARRESSLRGHIAYIDPRVEPSTRTAKVRVDVPNMRGDLRESRSGERVLLVPREAVQAVGDRSVVYVQAEGDLGRFVERTVKLGTAVGESVEVLDGLKPGELVVTTGSFFLRAEAGRTPGG